MDKKFISKPSLAFDFSFGKDIIAGIDEVGRGPWAGPVVSAVVVINQSSTIPHGIDDSKKISAKKREYLYNEITRTLEYAIAIIDVDIIDEIGVGKATKLSMQQAFEKIQSKPDIVLVDGRDRIEISADLVNVIKGDSQSVAIAAASIIAKVTRDRIMKDLALDYPNYSWDKNVGYGTQKHIEAINEHGITPLHRKSFKPIKEFLSL